MFTLVEAISLAGDRAKQNDDSCGTLGVSAWVIDGATDVHEPPVAGYASEASWIASELNATLHSAMGAYAISGATHDDLRREVRSASEQALLDYALFQPTLPERWRLPTSSLLIISQLASGEIAGLDLSDSRCFALDADGVAHVRGGPDRAADNESIAAASARKRAGDVPLLRDPQTLDYLRQQRAAHNLPGNYWVFGLQPECADHARAWTLNLKRPAHILLMTDGLAALADRYGAYTPGALVQAALDKGLQELGRELRAIENADQTGAQHPRFKKSDDATGLLIRLT